MDKHQKMAVKKCGGNRIFKMALKAALTIASNAEFYWMQTDWSSNTVKLEREQLVFSAHLENGGDLSVKGAGRALGEFFVDMGTANPEKVALEKAQQHKLARQFKIPVRISSRCMATSYPDTVKAFFVVPGELPVIITIIGIDGVDGKISFKGAEVGSIKREDFLNVGLPVTSAGKYM